MTTTNNTFMIPEWRLPELKAKIEKLNRRARKLGVPEVSIVEGERVVEDHPELEGVKIAYITTTIEGPAPVLNGYTFCATLEHVDGEVMLRTSPAFEGDLPKHFRTADPYNCDHCHTRRVRHETFVVKHESGDFKQIGRNCLVDFLGGKTAQAFAAAAEILLLAHDAAAGEESMGGSFGGGGNTINIEYFLSLTALNIRKNGWLSRKVARDMGRDGTATADQVLGIMFCRDPMTRKQYERDGVAPSCITEEDRKLAADALNWARTEFSNKPVDDRNDFEHNMAVATKNDDFPNKAAGVVAYVVAGFQKHNEKLLLRKLEVEKLSGSQHFGEVGKRVDFYARLIKLTSIDGMYGTTWIHTFLTREGNVVVWFASNRPTFNVVPTEDNRQLRDTDYVLKEGSNVIEKFLVEYKEMAVEPGEKEYLITGTVKKHDERNGVKQTVMSRCTLWTDQGRETNEAKLARKAAREAKKVAKAAKAQTA